MQINELALRVTLSSRVLRRNRNANFIATGFIDYNNDEDVSRNGVYLNLVFYGQDGSAREIIRGGQKWSIVNRDFTETEGLDTWTFTAVNSYRTRFEVIFRNENARAGRRSFNEDRPGRDEVFCWVQLRDADGTLLTSGQDSNTVSGSF